MRCIRFIFIIVAAVLGFSFTAEAVIPTPEGDIPEQTDPARITKRLKVPKETRRAPAQLVVPVIKKQTFPEAEKITFKLKEVRIEGSTVYKKADLQPLFKDKIGKEISVAQLQELARAITVKYQRDGYILSRAVLPPQRIKQGVVKLQIIEGFIKFAKVKGPATEQVFDLLQIYSNKIAAVKPLKLKRLERYALLANDIPGVTVKTVIAPSKETTGAADLTFIVEHQRLDGYASYDNRGTRLLGPHQYTGAVHANNLLGVTRTGLRAVVTTDFDELRFFELTHQQQIGTEGFLVRLDLEYTHTEPDFTAIGLPALATVEGESHAATLSASYPVIRSRRTNFLVTGDISFLNSKTETATIKPLFNDRLRTMSVGASVDFADKFRGSNFIAAEVTQGLNLLGAKSNPPTRVGGKIDFTKLTGEASRLQGLPHNFSVLLAATGQYAFSELLSPEEFGFGGSYFGRGYDPSEITGDHGLAGKVELRYDAQTGWKMLSRAQLYAFYDAGAVWNINTDSQFARLDATSAGGGVRVNFNKYLYGNVEVTKPISRIVANEGDKDARWYFAVTAQG